MASQARQRCFVSCTAAARPRANLRRDERHPARQRAAGQARRDRVVCQDAADGRARARWRTVEKGSERTRGAESCAQGPPGDGRRCPRGVVRGALPRCGAVHACMRLFMRACVCACPPACPPARVRACMPACACACVPPAGRAVMGAVMRGTAGRAGTGAPRVVCSAGAAVWSSHTPPGRRHAAAVPDGDGHGQPRRICRGAARRRREGVPARQKDGRSVRRVCRRAEQGRALTDRQRDG